jgi:hypothetical protein
VKRNGGARIRELQRALTSLPGVRGARVQFDAAGKARVRVLVVPERDVAETVRDVRGMALGRLRVDIDPARIDVLSVGDATGPRRAVHRRKLASLAVERSNGRFVARVSLDLAGDRLVGVSEVPSVHRFECRSVATAVLEGVRELVQDRIMLDEVEIISMGEARLAVVTLERGSRPLIASALVRSDDYDAIARATLHALNRVLR